MVMNICSYAHGVLHGSKSNNNNVQLYMAPKTIVTKKITTALVTGKSNSKVYSISPPIQSNKSLMIKLT